MHVGGKDLHPYRLVILDACGTWTPEWAAAFGMGLDTNRYTLAEYVFQEREPRAFVGRKSSAPAPTVVWYGEAFHQEYCETLQALFVNWMSGYTIQACIDEYHKKLYSIDAFKKTDPFLISGCYQLKREAQ